MSKIKPILNILVHSTNKVSRFVQKPNIIKINPSELRYVVDGIYKPQEDLWYFDAIIEQKTLTV